MDWAPTSYSYCKQLACALSNCKRHSPTASYCTLRAWSSAVERCGEMSEGGDAGETPPPPLKPIPSASDQPPPLPPAFSPTEQWQNSPPELPPEYRTAPPTPQSPPPLPTPEGASSSTKPLPPSLARLKLAGVPKQEEPKQQTLPEIQPDQQPDTARPNTARRRWRRPPRPAPAEGALGEASVSVATRGALTVLCVAVQ